uniref:Dolichyl-diphosphooligosaccharide--protein glycosyltransferase 48 kDa subunit n=1 Tax=Heterosigma akashiwo TaxID=2829 RepID=A0A7S3XL48_HETAK
MKTEDTHSMFLETLKDRGHQITVATAESNDLRLIAFGAPLYDNIILLCPEWEEGGSVKVDDVMGLVEGGANLMVFGDVRMGGATRRVAARAGADFDKEGTQVVDHFSWAEGLGGAAPHTVVRVGPAGVLRNAWVLGPAAAAGELPPVLYRGLGHAVDAQNILAQVALAGGPTTYSAALDAEIESYPENAGRDTALVSAVQARNNARVSVAGSATLCSNRYQLAPGAGNAAFCAALSAWALGERGVLRARGVMHHRADGSAPELLLKEKERADLPPSLFADPEITRNSLVYRVNDDVAYSFAVEVYNGEKWEPFNTDDLQIEFVMLDPYIRKTMTNDGQGGYSTTLKTPDVYGVFKFHVLYRRPGLSVINFDTQVSVRPFKHDEYERFIPAAFPYYAGAFSTMAGFFVFSLFFLYSK